MPAGLARRIGLALAFAACLAAPALPQDDDPIRLESDLVTVDVTVTNAKGEYVTDLKQSEVRLVDDGEPRELAFFGRSDTTALSRPLVVVLALDVSGSITREEVKLQRESAMRFMDLVRPESLFAVLAFNQEVRVLQKFTNKPAEVSRAFDKIKETGGSTRILDTIDESIRMLREAPSRRGGRRLRRVVVVVTDGFDSSSIIAPAELVRRAAAAEVTIYSITLPSYLQSLAGTRERAPTLLEISRVIPSTGGIDFLADSYDFTPFFKAIAEEVRAGYQLAFYPPEGVRTAKKFRQLRVEVSRPGVTVRASRQGYEVGK